MKPSLQGICTNGMKKRVAAKAAAKKAEVDNMIKDLTTFYSKSAISMRRSEIRELLKVTRQPDMISFGGGKNIG